MTTIPVSLALEDALTEFLTLRILSAIPRYATRTIYNRGGSGYLRRTINGFNNAAKGEPFWVATDLDHYECPPALLQEWLTNPRHHNLMVSVAVREAEAWVLADREGFASFLGISVNLIPTHAEALQDPKQTLIALARRCRRKELREDICPPANSTRKIGPNYNARLGKFVNEHWNPEAARQNSPSLNRAIERLTVFQPHWPPPG